jgi:hypothetical protein
MKFEKYAKRTNEFEEEENKVLTAFLSSDAARARRVSKRLSQEVGTTAEDASR